MTGRIATTTAISEARKAIERAEEALGSEIGALLAEIDMVRAQYEERIAALTEQHAAEMAGAKRVQEQLAQTHRRIVGQLTEKIRTLIVGQLTEKIRTLEAEPRNSGQIST